MPISQPLSPDQGTYALIMNCRKSTRLSVGKLGHMLLQPGFYIYVGSSRGPGGIRARVSRHRRRKKKLHWHIDYLRQQTALIETWTMTGTTNYEHDWAAALAAKYTTAHKRFGASDCRCSSHLFYAAARPPPDTIDTLCHDMAGKFEVKIF